jgi:hypothetical protein
MNPNTRAGTIWNALLSFPFLLLIGAFLLFFPFWLRVFAGDPLILGTASYLQLNTAPTTLQPYAALLRLLSPLGDTRILLSVFLGLLSLFLVNRLTGFLARRPAERGLVLLLFLINPLFLSIFTTFTPFTFVVPLALALLLCVREGRFLFIPLLAGLITVFSPVAGLLLVLSLVLLLPSRREALLFTLVVVCALAIILALASPGAFAYVLSLPIAEFGVPMGISFLYVSLAIFEGLLRWSEHRSRGASAMLFALLALASYYPAALVGAGLAVAPFAALFVLRLLKRRWALREVRIFTLLLLLCSFLFLIITHLGVLRSQEPSRALVQTLAALPPDSGVVLSPAELGPMVESISGHPVLLSADTCAHSKELCADIDRLYRARRLADAQEPLDKHHIAYLLITREMRDGRVWNRDDEGLLFLLQNSGRFAKLASDARYELWRYTP